MEHDIHIQMEIEEYGEDAFVIGRTGTMCEKSLPPHIFKKWEEVLVELQHNVLGFPTIRNVLTKEDVIRERSIWGKIKSIFKE